MSGHLIREADELLRKWLKTSKLQPGKRLPSERALAKELGFQRFPLSRAILGLIAEGMIEREGNKLFYAVPAPSGPQADFSCELVLHRRSARLKYFRKTAKLLGMEVKLRTYESTEEAATFLAQLESQKPEGVLFDPPFNCPASLWEPAVLRLMSHGIPVVIVGVYTSNAPCVVSGSESRISAHLEELGHREIVGVSARQADESWGKKHYFPKCIHKPQQDACELAEMLVTEWKQVTALIVDWESSPILPFLLKELSRRHRHVPKDLSILCHEGAIEIQRCDPPISVIKADTVVLTEVAFRLLQGMTLNKGNSGSRRPVFCVRVDDHLVLRSSTAPAPGFSPAVPDQTRKEEPKKIVPADYLAWSENPKKLSQNLEYSLRRPYSLAARSPESFFAQIDLRSFVNRPLNFRRGWLGDKPLTHFPAGLHFIHGVPFHVLGGKRRTDCGALVFRSTASAMSKGQKLPITLNIPIDRKADAIYILHGCGYAMFLQPFATYTFYQGEKKIDSIPLVTLGEPPPRFDLQQLSDKLPQANIQDWWPTFPQMDFLHARMAPITKNEDASAIQEHKFLYTLEWINPSPDTTISHLEIKVDATLPITLGVLSVSVLRANQNAFLADPSVSPL